MSDVFLEKIDETWCRIHCNPGILKELSEKFTFEVPEAKFMKTYRNKRWDGKIRLIKIGQKIYVGLAKQIKSYAKEAGYTFDSDFILTQDLDLNKNVRWNGIKPHDHQIHTIFKALKNKRAMFLSPTGSGKSLCIYTIARNLLNRINRTVIMVPTISLVEQMYSDIIDYSSEKFAEHNVAKFHGGTIKEEKPIIISTWQTMMTMSDQWLADIDCIIGDEAHLYKGKEITKLLERCKGAEFRYGFTGTLDGKNVNELILEGLFGPIHKIISTTQLIQEKKLCDFKIECIALKYKKKKFEKYQEEIEYIISNEQRTKFIADLATRLKGNTLILFSRVESHGELIYKEILKNKNDLPLFTQDVFYIHGGVPADVRESVRKHTEKSTNTIIVASSQIFSTGINITTLQNIIFAYPSKSRVRTLQSIGRALRVAKGKEKAVIYDIADQLQYSWQHFIERLKIYNTEDFNYNIIELELEKMYGKQSNGNGSTIIG